MRLHIGIFGRRNVGKSSLLNAVTKQNVSIVSSVAGTTTDPVDKPMELLPLGPVVFIDTAGIDDEGALGELRLQKTRAAIERTDIGIVVATGAEFGSFEEGLLAAFDARDVPVVVVLNKVDLWQPDDTLLQRLQGRRVVQTAVASGFGIDALRQALLAAAPADWLNNRTIVGDLVGPGGLCILVVPIDKETPRGRLILPEVQTIRDLLDSNAWCMVVKDQDLRAALEVLNVPPRLVVTDSQAFLKVGEDTPPSIPMTSFSILFARHHGDLTYMVEATHAVDTLRPGDRVLICEACTHHPIGEDIGRVKIPHWLMQYVGGELAFTHVQGHDFPPDLASYKLVIQCGSCMLNRREVLNRILHCREAGVPMTNYGLTIAYSLGLFERALAPFPAALEAHHRLGSPRGPGTLPRP